MEIGLVLSGGGAKGAFEVGVIAAVRELGLEPTVLSGTSAGAINASALAIGMDVEELAGMWRRLHTEDVYHLRRDLRSMVRPRQLLQQADNFADRVLGSVSWTWFLDTSPLRRLLRTILGGEHLTVLPGTTLTVTAVEALTGDVVRFTNTPLPAGRTDDRVEVVPLTLDHVLASAAMPLLFAPVEIDGRMFWDGALLANTPLSAALAHEPEVVVAVTTSPMGGPPRPPRTLGEAISLLAEDLLRASLLRELWHAETVNELVRYAPSRSSGRLVELILVEPERSSNDRGLLDFEPARAARLISEGREVGLRSLERWLEARAAH